MPQCSYRSQLKLFLLLAISIAYPNNACYCDDSSSDYLIERASKWRYFASKEEPTRGWRTLEYDDTNWKSGKAGFGYGDLDDATVLSNMRGRFDSVLIRKSFEIENPNDFRSLHLYINYDDGFIAYLNGTKVASASVSNRNGRLRIELHEADGFEKFDLSKQVGLLREGTNVLAIEGHNANINSSDFTLDPILTRTHLENPISLFRAGDFADDLDVFEERLIDQSSYLTLRKFDYEAAISRLRRSIDDSMTLTQFTLELRKIVMQLGDCHASVKGGNRYSIHGYLPFRFADTDKGLAALKLNSAEPLDPRHPYVTALDGVPISQWLEIASRLVPHGSPHLQRERALWQLSKFDMFRSELSVPKSDFVTISVADPERKKTRDLQSRLTQQGYSVTTIKLSGSRMLDNNIGYLRIPAMDKRLVPALLAKIQSFRDTNGLILDVRGNGGGTQHILRAIYSFFVPADSGSYVNNIAAYRLSSRFTADHIAYRPTHREDWHGWNEDELDAIRKAKQSFHPAWLPPKNLFSDWHYMLLNRRHAYRPEDHPIEYFHYSKPIAVLCDAQSFSATDGFLSAIADLPQATLIGQPSGGGSGARRRFELPRTRIVVSLSSMASYRPNGKNYDGNGIEVDIEVKPPLDDFIDSEADSVLETAVTALNSAMNVED